MNNRRRALVIIIGICIISTLKAEDVVEVSIPQADKDLARGFWEGSKLAKHLNLTSCNNDFEGFVSFISNFLEDLVNHNKVASVYNFGNIFIKLHGLMSNCQGTKEKLNEMAHEFYNIYLNPQQFMLKFYNHLYTFHVVKQFIALKGKIKARDFYRTGYILGDIMYSASTNDIDPENLTTYDSLNFLAIDEKSCSEHIKSIIFDFFKLLKSLVRFDLKQFEKDVVELVTKFEELSKYCF